MKQFSFHIKVLQDFFADAESMTSSLPTYEIEAQTQFVREIHTILAEAVSQLSPAHQARLRTKIQSASRKRDQAVMLAERVSPFIWEVFVLDRFSNKDGVVARTTSEKDACNMATAFMIESDNQRSYGYGKLGSPIFKIVRPSQ
jgi:hypothetical protein